MDSLPTTIIADRFPPSWEFVMVGRKLWVIIDKMPIMTMVVRMTLKMIVARITKLTRVTLPGLRAHGGLRPLPRSRPSPRAALPRWTQDRDRVRRRRRGGVQLFLRFFTALLANVASSFFVSLVIKVASNLFSNFPQLTKVASTSESDSSTVSEVSSVEEGTRGQENQAYQV